MNPFSEGEPESLGFRKDFYFVHPSIIIWQFWQFSMTSSIQLHGICLIPTILSQASWKNPQDLPFEQIFRNLGTNIFQNVGWSQQGLFDFLPNQVTWIYCHTTKFDHFCSNKSNWKKLYRIQIRSNSHATFEGKGKFQAANHNGHLFWDFVPLTWLPPPPKKKKYPPEV